MELSTVIDYLSSLYPGRHIKIGTFRTERIGHFISETDEVLTNLSSVTDTNVPILNILFMPEKVCNEQIRTMYYRTLSKIPHVEFIDCRHSSLGRLILPIAKLFTDYIHKNKIIHPNYCGPLTDGGIDRSISETTGRPFISFLPEEVEFGWDSLHELGITEETPYVTFHVRDNAYLQHALDGDWSCHDYRDPPLESYIYTVERLLSLGFKVIRMGSKVNQKFPLEDPNFFDYATSPVRNDFLDVFLFSNCTAHIGCTSGIDQFATAFEKPVALVNVIPALREINWSTSLITYSCCGLSRNGKPLSFDETLQYDLASTHEYQNLGLTVDYNSPEQIWHTVETLITSIP